MTKYSLDPAWEHEKERLDAQAAMYDRGTFARIEALGIEKGWQCAEIGGGTGTVSRWLSDAVGEGGHVLATDLDTRFLNALRLPNVEVRKHDIVSDTLESTTYDLVHVRLVLMHLGEGHSTAIAHMVDALKPGGWLLAEEMDNVTAGQLYPEDQELERVSLAMKHLQKELGVDGLLGRKLASRLEQAGLQDVESDGRVTLLKQGTDQMNVGTLFFRFQRDRLVDAGLVSGEAVDDFLERQASEGNRRMMPPLLVAAWGRKPAG